MHAHVPILGDHSPPSDAAASRPIDGTAARASGTPIRAVLFDVDGTLYSQPRLRALVAGDLLAQALRAPFATARAARILRAFRRTREELRHLGQSEQRLESLQYVAAARMLGIDAMAVQAVVDEWILRRPLRRLPQAIRPGLLSALGVLTARAIRLGALSDYPVADKLRALGVEGHFSVSLCTTDASINAFKPHPIGFWRACELWGLTPQEVLYVGDRPEIDAVGAAAAGLHCAIIGGRRDADGQGNASILRQFGDLPALVGSN